MKSLPIIDSKEEKIVNLLTELGFTRSYSFGIVWERGNLEICTDYQVSLSISLYTDNLSFQYGISLICDLFPEDEIKKGVKMAEYIENQVKKYGNNNR